MGSQEVAAPTGLVAALEQAALMAKQLPTSTSLEHSQILQIYSSLHKANHHLTLFLSRHSPPPSLTPFQPHQPSFLPTPPPPPPPLALPENSVSSAVGGGDDKDIDPMQMGDDDDEVEHNSKNTCTSTAAAIEIEGVEERMRGCFIQNKKPKRPLSPSSVAAVAEQWRSYVNEVAAVRGCFLADQFDPEGTRLRCTICLGDYEDKDVLRIMHKCGHSFHLSCIDIWLRKQSTCPVCRLSVQESFETKYVQPAIHRTTQSFDNPEISVEQSQHSQIWLLPAGQRSEGSGSTILPANSVPINIESTVSGEAAARS